MSTSAATSPWLVGLTVIGLLAGCATSASPTPTQTAGPPSAVPTAVAATAVPAVSPSGVPTAAPVTTPPSTPTPSAIAYGPVAVVTGTLTCPSIDFGPTTTDASGVEHGRAGSLTCDAVTNDPRVTGTSHDTFSADYWGTADHLSGALVQWGTSRLVSPGGVWVAKYAGI